MSSVWWALPAAKSLDSGSVGDFSINDVDVFLKLKRLIITFCLIAQPNCIGKVPWMSGD